MPTLKQRFILMQGHTVSVIYPQTMDSSRNSLSDSIVYSQFGLPVDQLTTLEFNLQTLCGFLCLAGEDTSLPPVYTSHCRPKKVVGTAEKLP